ncbi:hypothetical protein, partial [Nocardia brasiliensis]|uniref:hypothetical protein n=1 Tax=Nocardia brasiliensis TaxID=37326 RepID=UPI002453977B
PVIARWKTSAYSGLSAMYSNQPRPPRNAGPAGFHPRGAGPGAGGGGPPGLGGRGGGGPRPPPAPTPVAALPYSPVEIIPDPFGWDTLELVTFLVVIVLVSSASSAAATRKRKP